MLVTANIFQPLIDVFEAVIKFFHNQIGVPWGWAIVLLTVVIRALLVPLTLKQFHSMQRLQRLQPQLKEIQNKYKEDKQRQQQELMKFYKENNVNPLSSCLPLVAQLPVFISLFYMLRQSLRKDICPTIQHLYQQKFAAAHGITLHAASSHTTRCGSGHGAGFLFINDLTNKATGGALITLIILYVGSQLLSTVMMSAPGMDPNQRRLMMLLPLFFVLFIINFPAGVIVYWVTTNLWTIVQQYVVKRRLGPVAPLPTTSGGSGPGRGGGGGGGKNGDSPKDSGDGGLGGLLRGKLKPAEEPAPVGASARSGPPPPPPRKKKKRSGRRR
jgi:YidC/Oxa1 family membrane protein insertase